MEDKRESRLGTEPVKKLLLSLALPAVCSQLIMTIYNIVDRIFIGHTPGAGGDALTGVGIAVPVLIAVTALANLIGSGSASRAAIFMGSGENDKSEKIMGNAFTAAVIISISFTVLFTFFQVPILKLFGAGPESLKYAVRYTSIYITGTLFILLAVVLNMFISTQGFTKIGMLIIASGAVLNIFLDALFIFVLRTGVQGAAAATVISQAVSCVLAIGFLRGKKTVLKLKKENLRIEWKILGPCIALGTAPFVMIGTESLLVICFNSSLVRYGGDTAVGAMTIVGSIMECGLMIVSGITQGGQPIISYNYGAGRIDRVSEAVKRQTVACFSWSTIVWAFVMFFPAKAAGIFTNDPALVELSIKAVRVYAAGMLVLGLQISCQQAFIALGNAKTSTFLAFFRKLVMLIPLIYILPHLMENKVKAVFMAEPVSDIVAAAVTCSMFYMEFTKIRKKYESQ